ncbi:Bug family tripartite tricarboxylate transporter substrate binding protein [Chelatococcus asaccharovorans]|uniref:Bug family tripartite tricarboxylate transporter substrate binding protein n=1 Tax=Chelatococcus asaccharovorans TaxID=28210 RepID=UPI00224C7933|nr:tripartite tricarboxylate transporter substrate binding protein [Chelatococcus asaccharovorans]CAH1651684.1 Tripartite-type tricarboxylate transporter receptor subunit TctC [Chelatococcus asaccharovorans]CAH1693060.1 Tripartite-type tricarboxylate transporter receptor subunit TctC [Chelatococcus asaccharovorans]
MPLDISRRALLFAGLLPLVPSGAAFAQAWPSRPVTLVVPYAPGASNDTFTRALGDALSKRFGQPFVVDNRPGAGGVTGVNTVARAAPDGYTLVEMPNSILGFKPIMKVDIDPLKNLTPLGAMASAPTALVVPAALPVNSVDEFIAYARANPDKTFYGYAGIGTTQHQHMELFNKITGLKIKGVNYKSSSDAQTDLLAGRLQAMIVTIASTLGQIEGKELRLLAYTDDNYPPGAPKAPTMAEVGVKGMEKAQIWWGIFGPPGMPADLVATINAAINQSLTDPSVVALLAKSGATPMPGTSEQFVAMIKDEAVLVDEFVKLFGRKNP